MRYFNWLLGAILFLALLAFAIKNDQTVTLRYFLGFEWHTSLALVSLLFFVVGAMFGTLAMFVGLVRQRREIARSNKTTGGTAYTQPFND